MERYKQRAVYTFARGCHRILGPLSLLCLLLLAGCKVELYGELSEREANEMAAILLQNKIPTKRTADKDRVFTLHVQEDRFAEAVQLLNSLGYPRQSFANLGEVFAGDGLISSPIEERARLIYALSQELSRTITEVDGVLSARIHVVLPENDPLREDLTPSSASVFIRHDAAARIPSLLPKIKMLVANSIEGLVYDKVSVALFPVDNLSAGSVNDNALRTVAGLWVHDSSLRDAKVLIFSLIGVAAAGSIASGLLAWLWLQQRQRTRDT